LLRRTIGESIELRIEGRKRRVGDVLRSAPARKRAAQPGHQFARRDAGGRQARIETANAELDNFYAAEQRDVTPGQYVCLPFPTPVPGCRQRSATAPSIRFHHQADGAGNRPRPLDGLRFARQSEGHVRIYSEIDAGTTVKLYLPRYRGAAEERRWQHPRESRTGAGRRDGAGDRGRRFGARACHEVLNDLGYRALQARDGPSG
jgi:hypothetical protein